MMVHVLVSKAEAACLAAISKDCLAKVYIPIEILSTPAAGLENGRYIPLFKNWKNLIPPISGEITPSASVLCINFEPSQLVFPDFLSPVKKIKPKILPKNKVVEVKTDKPLEEPKEDEIQPENVPYTENLDAGTGAGGGSGGGAMLR